MDDEFEKQDGELEGDDVAISDDAFEEEVDDDEVDDPLAAEEENEWE